MRKRTRIILGALIALIIVSGVGLVISAQQLEPRLRDWVTSTLSESLESDVELGAVKLNWVPLTLHAENLTVRHRGRTDVPPLLIVKSFTVDLRPTDLWSSTVEHVKVDGLEVNIPPKDAATGKRPLPNPAGDADDGADDDDSEGLVVKRLTATNTRMSIIPREEGKNPKVWDIIELDMKNLRSSEPATFTAALINPIPYGKIESSGTFGPWQSGEPGASPITGDYTFAADLGTIEGLEGDLNAVGKMGGTIEQIATTGQTRTEKFRLTELAGDALPLTTAYDAVVDGTKGDVELKRVDVHLGKSEFVAKGVVEGTKGVKGKRVVVNVKSSNANLGELLRFVSKGAQPPAYGRLLIDTAFDLPQGKEPVLSRLQLEGSVRAERVTFTSDTVQDKIDLLSRKGQGKPEDASIDEVASRLSTKFSLRNGLFTYQGLQFAVDGADVRLDGTHSLRSKTLNLAGEVRLQATVSETMTGFKKWFVKPFDPLFRKNGAGTRLVIKVEGTQDQPKIGLDFGKTLRGTN
jgi:AsmA-like C-terminal region